MVWKVELISNGDVILVTMNSNKANVMNSKFWNEMNECLDKIESDKKYGKKPLILTCDINSKAFSAGLDLKSFGGGKKLVSSLNRLLCLQRRTIAAIDNHAIAGGYFLTLCCDARVVKDGKFRIGFNEVANGFPFPGWIMSLMEHKLNKEILWKLINTGQLYSPKYFYENTKTIDVLLDRNSNRNDLINESIKQALIVPKLSIVSYLSCKNYFNKKINDHFENIKDYFDKLNKDVMNSKETQQMIAQLAMKMMKRSKKKARL